MELSSTEKEFLLLHKTRRRIRQTLKSISTIDDPKARVSIKFKHNNKDTDIVKTEGDLTLMIKDGIVDALKKQLARVEATLTNYQITSK